jgi:MKL/myocardin-like protein
VTKPQHPDHYITFEDDSQSSEGAPSPQLESRSSDVLETAAASAGIVTVSLSIPTTGGAVVVSSTSPVFQQSPTESTIQTFAELCNTVVGTQQQGQQQIQQGQQHTSQVSLPQEWLLISLYVHTRVSTRNEQFC